MIVYWKNYSLIQYKLLDDNGQIQGFANLLAEMRERKNLRTESVSSDEQKQTSIAT